MRFCEWYKQNPSRYKMKESWTGCGWKISVQSKVAPGCSEIWQLRCWTPPGVVDSQSLQATWPSLGWIGWSLPPPFLHFHLESKFKGTVQGISAQLTGVPQYIGLSECIPTLCTFLALHWSCCSLRPLLDGVAFRQRTVSLYCIESNTKSWGGGCLLKQWPGYFPGNFSF